MKRALLRIAILGIAVVVAVVAALASCATSMPGTSYAGALAPLTADEATIRDQLKADIEHLAGTIGERNFTKPAKLDEARTYLKGRLEGLGYTVREQAFETSGPARGQTFVNLEADLAAPTKHEELVVVGAHYDTAEGTPGADDNGSGVAALLALAKVLRAEQAGLGRTVRFVLFANEEPPFFNTDDMGSRHSANAMKARGDKLSAMLSLETVSFFNEAEGSQKYPFPFGLLYPSTGTFIAFVGDTGSVELARAATKSFRDHAKFPSEGAALPGSIPGVDWSDHASFWRIGVPAVMVTDTAPFRNPHYHEPTDVPANVDVDRLARVVTGLRGVVLDLARR